MTFTLFIPVYNEIYGMKQLFPQIDFGVVDEVIVVDGGSKDGSVEYAESLGLKVIHQREKGITYAYIEAMPYFKTDCIISFSPDGNSLPQAIGVIKNKLLEGYDMVIASRYLPPARSYDDDIITRFGNYLFTYSINILFGGRYTDSLVMLRGFRRELLNYARHVFRRSGMEPYLSIICAKHRFKVCEIPFDEPKRVGGKRKMIPVLNGLDILKLMFLEFFGL